MMGEEMRQGICYCSLQLPAFCTTGQRQGREQGVFDGLIAHRIETAQGVNDCVMHGGGAVG
jgi:hypothetical protein